MRIGKFASSRAASPGSAGRNRCSGTSPWGCHVDLALLADESAELAPQVVGLLHGGRPGRESGRDRTRVPRASRLRRSGARPGRPRRCVTEAVVGRAGERRHRHPGGRERGEQGAVERKALHGVLLGADHVEQPSEPARSRLWVERADLPEVARREMGLIGVRVSDRREDGQPSLRMELRKGLERRMPVQPVSERKPARRWASTRASCAASGSAGRRSDRGATANPSRRGRRWRPARDVPRLRSQRPGRCRRRGDAGRGLTRRTPSAQPRASATGTSDGRARYPRGRASLARSPGGRSGLGDRSAKEGRAGEFVAAVHEAASPARPRRDAGARLGSLAGTSSVGLRRRRRHPSPWWRS